MNQFSFHIPASFIGRDVFITTHVLGKDPSSGQTGFLGVPAKILEVTETSIVADVSTRDGVIPFGVNLVPMREVKWINPQLSNLATLPPGTRLKLS
jgi:hypothetical protein